MGDSNVEADSVANRVGGDLTEEELKEWCNFEMVMPDGWSPTKEFDTSLLDDFKSQYCQRASAESVWTCRVCGKTFKHRGNAEEHVLTKHIEYFKYRCECGYRTNRKYRMTEHLKSCSVSKASSSSKK